MITLTLEIEGYKQQTVFTKNPLIIGSGTPDTVDICLSILPLKSEHVKIIEEEAGQYLVINQTNDPYVLLNGFPFYKKKLKEGDLLTLYSVEITIDKLNADDDLTFEEGQNISSLLEKKILVKSASSSFINLIETEELFTPSFLKEMEDYYENLDDDEDEDEELDNSLLVEYSPTNQVKPNKGQTFVGWPPFSTKDEPSPISIIGPSPYLWKEITALSVLILILALGIIFGVSSLQQNSHSVEQTKILIPGIQIKK